jgi:hypothetical protein
MGDFQARMNAASDQVYARIVDPDEPAFDVEAELMQAHVDASEGSDD